MTGWLGCHRWPGQEKDSALIPRIGLQKYEKSFRKLLPEILGLSHRFGSGTHISSMYNNGFIVVVQALQNNYLFMAPAVGWLGPSATGQHTAQKKR